MNKKGFLQISFSWIFAILVGGFIIFLAIYATNHIKDSQANISDIEASKELGILLSPLEVGFEETKTSSFTMPKESDIHFRCNTYDTFGNQIIVVDSENFDKSSGNKLEIEFQNKYVFAEKVLKGKTFNLFSKQFSFPFKTATLIYVTPSENKYCFINPPRDIEEDIENLNNSENPQYLFIDDCPEESIKVCFNEENCEIEIDYYSGELKKEGETFYFQEDALMYGAIFSEKGNYDCQVKRLMKRVEILSNIYIEKAIVNPRNGCDSEDVQAVNSKLRILETFASNFESPKSLDDVAFLIQDIEQKNEVLDCRLW